MKINNHYYPSNFFVDLIDLFNEVALANAEPTGGVVIYSWYTVFPSAITNTG